MLLSTGVLIAFITLVHLWLLYLAWRRWNSFTKHPPDILTPFLPLEDYKRLRINVLKECSVMSAKIVLGLSINLWKLSISYQQLVWDAAKMLEYHNLPAAVWFVVLNTLITLSIEIPFEIMGLLFVSPDEYINIVAHFAQSMNNIGASCVLGGAAMWLAVFFQEQYNMYLVLVLANVFQFYNTITYIFHASIWLPLIARPLTDTFETERKIGELARKHGFPEKKILVDIEKNKEPSTYYYGIYGRFQLVVNLELTELINPQQTVALVAHELGRWKLNDNAYRMLFSVIEVIMFTILLYNSYNNPSIDKLFGFTTESKPHPLLRPYLARYFTWPVVYEAVRGPCNIYLSSLAYKADAWANQNGYGEELKAGLLAKIFHMATPEFDNLYSMWYWSQPSALKRVKHITKIPPTTIDSSTAEESSSSQMKKNK